jgi:hypothetical protein
VDQISAFSRLELHMKKTLRSFDTVWRFARLDTQAGRFYQLPLWRTILWRNKPADGWYKLYDGAIAALYSEGNGLYFWFNGAVLRLDDETSASLRHWEKLHRLILTRGTQRVQIDYRRPEPWPPISHDPTAFVDEEQIDFGLFVYRIVQDPGRRQRIVQARASADGE